MRVSVSRWLGPETIKHVLESIEAWDGFKEGMDVLLKPNAVMGGSPKISCRGITTSPVVVAAVIDLVREKGAKSVIIAEGSIELPSLKLDTAAAYAWSGLKALAKRKQVDLVDLNKGPHRAFTLSDNTKIEIAEAVYQADFVINLYNPTSKKRNWQIGRVREILLESRDASTPVGIVSRATREGEKVAITDLENMLSFPIDMQTVIIVGNSRTFTHGSFMVTPRGYLDKYDVQE